VIGKSKNRKPDYILFRKHLNKKDPIKPLDNLWDNFPKYKKENTIILDDNKDSVYTEQEENCINCPEFNYTAPNSEQDDFFDFLTEQLKELLKEYKKTKQVNTSVVAINKKISQKYKTV
jgi:hypothetical protein